MKYFLAVPTGIFACLIGISAGWVISLGLQSLLEFLYRFEPVPPEHDWKNGIQVFRGAAQGFLAVLIPVPVGVFLIRSSGVAIVSIIISCATLIIWQANDSDSIRGGLGVVIGCLAGLMFTLPALLMDRE